MRPLRSFSQRFLLVATMAFLLNSASNGLVGSYLALYPQLVLEHFQLWRLVTFPLASPGIAGMILLSMSMFLFAEELEQIYRKRLPLFMLGLTGFLGVGYTLLFQNSMLPLIGAEHLSFFVLTLFLWSFPRRAVEVFGAHIRGDVIILVSSFSFFTFSLVDVLLNKAPFFGLVLQSGLGIFSGLLTVFMYLQAAANRRRKIREAEFPMIPMDAPFEPVEEADYLPQQKRYPAAIPQHYQAHRAEISDEEHANQLLDKIFSQGSESLKPAERDFLEKYSQTLK